MKIGDRIQIVKCGACPKVVGKTGVITKFYEEGSSVEVKFGRGRPQKNRPNVFVIDDVSLIME